MHFFEHSLNSFIQEKKHREREVEKKHIKQQNKQYRDIHTYG